MNNQEFLKSIGVKILRENILDSEAKFIGVINGFFIHHKSYYWVVEGKLPIRFANELYKFRNSLGIRVSGGSNDNKPLKWCTSDEFEIYAEEQGENLKLKNISLEKFCELLKAKKKELMKKNIEDFYVAFYHIDSDLGLKKMVDIIKTNNITTRW